MLPYFAMRFSKVRWLLALKWVLKPSRAAQSCLLGSGEGVLRGDCYAILMASGETGIHNISVV